MLNLIARQQLKNLLPVGMVATKSWLLAQGINLHFLDNAVKSRTLLPLTPGVYAREEKPQHWKGVVASLQRMRDEPVCVGAFSALEIEGLVHYQARGSTPHIHLFSASPLPAWLHKIDIDAKFEWRGVQRLWPSSVTENPKYFREDSWRESLPTLCYSGPEKAFLELLADVPKSISVEHADQLMQGLTTLSPRKLDLLLQASSSIKVKRLFLWLANRHQHAWLKYLDPERYELGTGKREIAKGGRLDKTWQITVPREM
ncbi:type IV toxin-antitoxin system AbiEi family antitoxin domain-containing protein [Erwinia billingiae]|jgi:hypothetical protein|uniref:Conserved uncharacterized protein n=1 Tax=Erwinia billingiae (strain Eb661) TaxID=634500 RepID=D8MW35_ERWBE|nr:MULTISPECIES: type IV toxin-antitoxin system AbiEi family antitoxin [Erwinia]QBR48854.1 hypothetical protein E2F51_02075 [Erwinia sp. QL-Z3]CAX61042.1 Conserved uncharacterized protein [Erwinia billingiae Eb661]